MLGSMAHANGNGNGHASDDELARQALRDVLKSRKAGTRVKTAAARNLLRLNGSFQPPSPPDEEQPEDPMRDLDLQLEAWRALKGRGKRNAWREWLEAVEEFEDGVLSLDELEALLHELRAA